MDNKSLPIKKELNAVWQVLAFLILGSLISQIFIWPISVIFYAVIPLAKKPIGIFWLVNQMGLRSASLAATIVTSIICLSLFSKRDIKSLGFLPHKNFLQDFLAGSLISFLMVSVVALLQFLSGSTSYSVSAFSENFSLLGLIVLFFMIFIAAAFEEVLFRGYPLQVLANQLSPVSAVIIMSGLFALVHIGNSHATFFSTINTALAGIWLSVAYFKTRSLYLATGLHLGWNFSLGAIYGLPVSGVTELNMYSLLKTHNLGSAWLTGADYGPEGGAIGAIVLVIGIILLAKFPLLKVSPEMAEHFPAKEQDLKEQQKDQINQIASN